MWTYKIVPKPSTEEFVVRFYNDGVERKAARYYATDRADARGTGDLECARMNGAQLPCGETLQMVADRLRLDLDAAPRSTRTVTKVLKALGRSERLVTGRGYLYFVDGEAYGWYSSSVPVCYLRDLTLRRWIEEHASLARDARNH